MLKTRKNGNPMDQKTLTNMAAGLPVIAACRLNQLCLHTVGIDLYFEALFFNLINPVN